MDNIEKVGIAGVGALGSIVARALTDGMDGYSLHAVSNLTPVTFDVPNVDFETLVRDCDVIVECLPPEKARDVAELVIAQGKTMVMISSCTLVLYPELIEKAKASKARIIVPSGALSGLDAVSAMAIDSITEAKIISSKPPKGFKNAPYIIEKNIKLDEIQNRVMVLVVRNEKTSKNLTPLVRPCFVDL